MSKSELSTYLIKQNALRYVRHCHKTSVLLRGNRQSFTNIYQKNDIMIYEDGGEGLYDRYYEKELPEDIIGDSAVDIDDSSGIGLDMDACIRQNINKVMKNLKGKDFSTALMRSVKSFQKGINRRKPVYRPRPNTQRMNSDDINLATNHIPPNCIEGIWDITWADDAELDSFRVLFEFLGRQGTDGPYRGVAFLPIPNKADKTKS